jgi:outer membrane protein OmpA-like peptidoglycan-associated protein
VDTVPPKPVEKVAAPSAAPVPVEHYIQGSVFEKGAGTPIASAVVRYEGRPLTGMVTDDLGAFRSTRLLPGTYTFTIAAPGYRDGTCSATIPTDAPPRPPAGAPATQLPPQPVAPGSAPAGHGQIVIPVQCELEALPKLGVIVGSLIDSETSQPVSGARIKVTDRRNRELMLPGDNSGAFRVENVPPGRVRVSIEATGYFPTVTELEIKPLDELQARIVLNKRPVQPNVVVQGKEVKLRKQVHFETDSAQILPDSMALLEEIADVLKSRPEITSVEVQGHTDNTGSQAHNLRLSQDRAQAVVDALIRLDVDPSRLVAKGYGQEKPLLPNTSEPARARNRRVQIMIK